jgi:antitoxin component YwqK of YwqJK toxin-antitoxin module
MVEKYYPSGKIYSKTYYLYGNLCSFYGPAYIEYFESGNIKYEAYYIHGKRHRIYGPAVISYYNSGEIFAEIYWINDFCLQSFEKYCSSKEKIFEYIRIYPEYIKELNYSTQRVLHKLIQ